MDPEDFPLRWSLDDTRTMKCMVCGSDVKVNLNYAIESVTCTPCFKKQKGE